MKKYLYIIIISLLIIPVNIFAVTDEEIEEKLNDLSERINSLETRNYFLDVYPVGSVYITTSDDESTADKMSDVHGGTWESFGVGKTLLSSTSAGETGGSNTVTLTTSNIPTLSISGSTGSTGSGYTIKYTSSTRTSSSSGAHTHYASVLNAYDSSFIGYNDYNGDTLVAQDIKGGGTSSPFVRKTYTESAGAHTHTFSDYYASTISGVQAHTHTFSASYTNSSLKALNVQNEYITVYMWKRVS